MLFYVERILSKFVVLSHVIFHMCQMSGRKIVPMSVPCVFTCRGTQGMGIYTSLYTLRK